MNTEQTPDVDHGFYIDAVVQALKAAGLTVVEYEALADTYREAYIILKNPDGGQIQVDWHEERGWEAGARDQERGCAAYLEDLDLDLVARPVLVADAVLVWAGLQGEEDLEEELAAYLPADPDPDPDPADPRQIAVSLMLDAAHDPPSSNAWDAVFEHYPNMSDPERAKLVKKICELAETADITIGWAEVTA